MNNLQQLARLILNTADVRERSWQVTRNSYRLSIRDAARATVGEHNEETCRLVHMLLATAWNDAIDWARDNAT